eukprot:CAMPEP_0172679450 /NCGR_PEP_ID=MMETSP1074-20121228/16069_1 /TAXON_ID=2916 /ORGANISM="Ceratium fusus, Strain PA161109" /LENGTH=54 /DNA_ID=CAMNT_0013497623 /DNA_START=6 /DNA_END=167 /DNA_ORIENTATION=-
MTARKNSTATASFVEHGAARSMVPQPWGKRAPSLPRLQQVRAEIGFHAKHMQPP